MRIAPFSTRMAPMRLISPLGTFRKRAFAGMGRYKTATTKTSMAVNAPRLPAKPGGVHLIAL